jgi:hypothetical protein
MSVQNRINIAPVNLGTILLSATFIDYLIHTGSCPSWQMGISACPSRQILGGISVLPAHGELFRPP